jgi:hypothetical protein
MRLLLAVVAGVAVLVLFFPIVCVGSSAGADYCQSLAAIRLPGGENGELWIPVVIAAAIATVVLVLHLGPKGSVKPH